MKKINWKVRCSNKTFWVTLIPVLIILITDILDLFDIKVDLSALQDKILNIVSIIFIALGILGITNDPTTRGLKDSDQAMQYEEPKE